MEIDSFTNSLKKIRTGFSFVYKIFIEPNNTSEDARRREFIFNVILFSLFLLASFSFLTLIYNIFHLGLGYHGIALAPFTIIWLSFLLLIGVSRKIDYRIAAYIFFVLFFVLITYMNFNWGVDLSTKLLMEVILILMASILVSTRFGFLVTGLVCMSIIVFSYLEAHAIFAPNAYWRGATVQTDDGVHYTAIFLVIMAIAWLSNREIERSLTRARDSEAALKQERDSLEVKVEERAQEIKKMQLESIKSLNHFAKFGRLASGLFHDFVNPLTAISLSLSEISEIKDKEKISGIEYELQQATVAANKLHEFVQLVRNHLLQQEVRTTFDIRTEISKAIEILSYKSRKEHVKIQFDPKNIAPMPIINNPVKFHQVMVNLIINAMDAYQDLGQGGVVNVGAYIQKDNYVITVKDWGVGISAENVHKIFEPFYTTKNHETGTGIGLTTSREIIETDFGGIISVQSVKNEVTVFTITIPKMRVTVQDALVTHEKNYTNN